MRFVLFGQSRSGSTLVVNLLDSHPDIVCEGELFNADWGYYRRQILRVAWRLPDPFLWNRLVRCRVAGYGAKILVYQVQSAPVLFGRLQRRGWKLIAITRRDMLRASLSKQVARATATWHRLGGVPSDHDSVAINPDLIIDELRRRHVWENVERQIMEELDHYSLEYERDLLLPDARSAALEKVVDYLGIRPAELETKLIRSDERPLGDRVANLEEILQAVEDSTWSPVLDRFDPGFL